MADCHGFSFQLYDLKQQGFIERQELMRNGCAISLALIEGSDFGQTSLLKKEKTKEMLNAKVHVMGPCNGIFGLLTNWDSVALWNPANRESRALPTQTFPNSIPPRMELERSAFGFGMDPFTGDYKVVSVRTYRWGSGLDDDIHPSNYPKHIAIYSLRDDSWRDFKGFFPECSVSPIRKFYTYMDGVYYWSASDKNGATKLSFHMGYEASSVTASLRFFLSPTPPVALGKSTASLTALVRRGTPTTPIKYI
ncbi:hypothetical protein LOK49_LG09G01483 [Camellia lanceoleosa]|uniref:Uncharacterized protein n=1 Tax=Camellia lanceoleosa TaxID=1840588 RepID=A0ACC0GJK4_9ERIC|nr:hypothetical protein LOK49_LG09G01483 [Camellia lanceoleosa]